MSKTNIYLSQLLSSFQLNKNKILIYDTVNNNSHSYDEFLEKTLGFISFLKKKKLNKNDKIIIKLDNSVEYLIILTSCILGGFTACPIDIKIPRDKYHKLKKIIKPKLILDKTKNIKYLNKVNKKNLVENDHTALILFTSGTTGEPKGIKLKKNSYIGLANSFGNLADYDKDTKIYHCLPMHYNAGILNTFFAAIFKGSSIYLGPKVDSINILTLPSQLSKYSIDTIHLTPEIANGLSKINTTSDEKNAIKKINKIICTGSYLHEITRENFEKKFNTRLYSCYGLTEIGGPISLENWEDTFEENSVGRVLKEVKIKIQKKSKLNHILVKSPYLFKGYLLENNKIERPKLDKGYFNTGDIGKKKGPHLFINGRRKDIFKKGSEIISSKELENIIKKYKSVDDCFISIVDDLSKGSKINLFVLFKKKYQLDLAIKNLSKYLIKKLKKIEMPEKIIPVPSILKTSNGKIKKHEMENIYL